MSMQNTIAIYMYIAIYNFDNLPMHCYSHHCVRSQTNIIYNGQLSNLIPYISVEQYPYFTDQMVQYILL